MNFCTTCGTRLVARTRFCTSCGAPLSATPAESDTASPPPPTRVALPVVAPTAPVDVPVVAPQSRVDVPVVAPPPRGGTTDEQVLPWLRSDTGSFATVDADLVAAPPGSQRGVPVALVVVITAAILVGLAVFVGHSLSGDSKDETTSTATSKTSQKSSAPTDEPSEQATVSPSTPAPEPVKGTAVPGLPAGAKDVSAGSDIAAPPSSKGRVDSNGRPAHYPAKAMLDTDPATAWRMDGDGSGQTITVSFGRRVTVTGLALDPGFDKTGKDEDRWKENRRISAATFTTDDGSAFTVSFATDLDLPVGDRLQSFSLPGPVKTRTLRVHIDATEPMPPHTNDTTAISRLAVLGS